MFIVLEGIDGAGKGRQRLEVGKYIQTQVKKFNSLEYPNHQSTIYKHIIHKALHEEIKLTPASWFLSFVLDQSLDSDIIRTSIKSRSNYTLVDGYFTTTIAYQCLLNKFFSVKDALTVANILKIPKPDIGIFIDVDPLTAQKRKMKEEGHDEGMDIFERSLQKQKAIRKAFLKMAKDSILCKWIVVEGNSDIPTVTDNIIRELHKHKFI